MRKLEICRKKITLEGDNNLEVVYYITVDDLFNSDGVTVLESYGVGIQIPLSGEEDNIKCITADARKIYAIVHMLSEGTVTPVGLRDVLYDLQEVMV